MILNIIIAVSTVSLARGIYYDYSSGEGSETKKFCLRDFEIFRFPRDFKIS